ncbi:MAG TPA: ATP-binding cassette domain-containing protein [Solirubrobacteraceae bacterium]|nr:ATP-binding cassette domain-containing protein [Solirubrobacteraceae bacterium]
MSFRVDTGEIVGLVGRNGAGKTTTMRSIMGIVRPDQGSVSWREHPVGDADRLRFGYMPEERGLYPQMPVVAQVAYFARLHGMPAESASRAALGWVERLGLGDRGEEKLVALSHGNQQRVQLAVALVHDPELLVLDEPFSGLDPEAVDSLSSQLRDQAAGGKAILFSSHQLELVERICKRVVIVDRGRMLACGSLRELRERFPAQLRVRVDAPPDWASSIIGVKVVRSDEDGVVLVVEPGVDPQAVLRAAQAHGPVEHFGFETAGLVDLYRQMVLG